MSRAPLAWTWSCTAWASPPATSTTTVFPTCSSRASGRAVFSQYRQGHVRGRDPHQRSRRTHRVHPSAMWLDFDRDGFWICFVGNYVRWSAEHDVFLQPRRDREVVLHAGGLSRRDVRLFRNRGNARSKTSRPRAASSIRARKRWASRCSMTIGTAGRIFSSPRYPAKQAVSQPAQRHIQGRRPRSGCRAEYRRQGARRHGSGRRRLSTTQVRPGSRHEL